METPADRYNIKPAAVVAEEEEEPVGFEANRQQTEYLHRLRGAHRRRLQRSGEGIADGIQPSWQQCPKAMTVTEKDKRDRISPGGTENVKLLSKRTLTARWRRMVTGMSGRSFLSCLTAMTVVVLLVVAVALATLEVTWIW